MDKHASNNANPYTVHSINNAELEGATLVPMSQVYHLSQCPASSGAGTTHHACEGTLEIFAPATVYVCGLPGDATRYAQSCHGNADGVSGNRFPGHQPQTGTGLTGLGTHEALAAAGWDWVCADRCPPGYEGCLLDTDGPGNGCNVILPDGTIHYATNTLTVHSGSSFLFGNRAMQAGQEVGCTGGGTAGCSGSWTCPEPRLYATTCPDGTTTDQRCHGTACYGMMAGDNYGSAGAACVNKTFPA
jgi:hypothetical protein